MKAWCGIDPKTKRCEIIGSYTKDTLNEISKEGYIAVPALKEKARAAWGEIVEDIYLLAETTSVGAA
jgi:hypothetical protein